MITIIPGRGCDDFSPASRRRALDRAQGHRPRRAIDAEIDAVQPVEVQHRDPSACAALGCDRGLDSRDPQPCATLCPKPRWRTPPWCLCRGDSMPFSTSPPGKRRRHAFERCGIVHFLVTTRNLAKMKMDRHCTGPTSPALQRFLADTHHIPDVGARRPKLLRLVGNPANGIFQDLRTAAKRQPAMRDLPAEARSSSHGCLDFPEGPSRWKRFIVRPDSACTRAGLFEALLPTDPSCIFFPKGAKRPFGPAYLRSSPRVSRRSPSLPMSEMSRKPMSLKAQSAPQSLPVDYVTSLSTARQVSECG